MRERAFEQVGHLYPKVRLPPEEGGGQADVIAWIWARTVPSPDPSWNGHVPLVRSWIVRKPKKNKPVVWIQPVVDSITQTINYRIRVGGGEELPQATIARAAGTCIATGTPIPRDYLKRSALAGRMDVDLIAVVAEGSRGRAYVEPVVVPEVSRPTDIPSGRLSTNTRHMSTPSYGLNTTESLFTERQLVSLSTFSKLLGEVHCLVRDHAREAGLVGDDIRLRDRGSGAEAYADALVTYLAFSIDKLADLNNSLVAWEPDAQCPRHLFGRQSIPMIWDFAEANPLGSSSGSWQVIVNGIVRAFRSHAWPVSQSSAPVRIAQRDAVSHVSEVTRAVVCTDPPYYDNVPYADLSDFFYVWLRHNLADVWQEETATLLTPKAEELVADSHRSGSKPAAKYHFEEGMTKFLKQISGSHSSKYPATPFYAFKQQETKRAGTASTGWETFLQSLVDAGLQVTATWPIRTETRGRLRAMKSAALASSVVIACRPLPVNASLATRREFLDALDTELPAAVRLLQDQVIAPVDMAQSAIGPGMEVFSRYARVLEADGSPMRVRAALALINEALEDVLSAEETEFDADTRWALTWYQQNGHDSAPFGDAETLFKAKVTSVAGVVQARIAESKAGRVRLLTRNELDEEWDPLVDRRLTVWRVAQHLIARLDHSEMDAADLLRKVGSGVGDRARRLVYLLYQIADRKGWASDAVAYNGLIRAWHDIARLAAAGQGPVAQTFEGM